MKDDNSSCDLRTETAHSLAMVEAMSQTPGVLDDDIDNTTGEASSSKHVNSDTSTTRARRAKRRCPDAENTVDQAGESKVDQAFTPEDLVDGNVQCVCLDSECIPLYPQYKHRTQEGRFVRVGKWEPWVMRVIAVCRKSALKQKGYEPQKGQDKKASLTRKLVSHVVTELHSDFRQILKEARKEFKKICTLKHFPEVCSIKMHGCEVVASTMTTRHLYILADDTATKWIHRGIAPAVQNYIEKELKTMSFDFSPPPHDEKFSEVGFRAGVRDKVYWRPHICAWQVKAKCEKGEQKRYCAEKGYDLFVPRSIGGSQEFKAAKDVAFHNACLVWNALDKSQKPRIKLIERPLQAPMQYLHKRKAMSHTDSEPDSSTEATEDSESGDANSCGLMEPIRTLSLRKGFIF